LSPPYKRTDSSDVAFPQVPPKYAPFSFRRPLVLGPGIMIPRSEGTGTLPPSLRGARPHDEVGTPLLSSPPDFPFCVKEDSDYYRRSENYLAPPSPPIGFSLFSRLRPPSPQVCLLPLGIPPLYVGKTREWYPSPPRFGEFLFRRLRVPFLSLSFSPSESDDLQPLLTGIRFQSALPPPDFPIPASAVSLPDLLPATCPPHLFHDGEAHASRLMFLTL